MDTLDFTGPLEIFNYATKSPASADYTASKIISQPSYPQDKLFDTTVCALEPFTTTAQKVTIARDISFKEAELRLKEWDMVLVPGGSAPAHMDSGAAGSLIGLLRAYAALAESEKCHACGHGQARLRTLFSVCTGSLFLAKAGLLEGRTATTHWGSLDLLRKGKYGKVGEVVEDRFVVNQRRKREGMALAVITSGGISAGMDAALWYVGIVGDDGAREGVERMLEYKGRSDEGCFV